MKLVVVIVLLFAALVGLCTILSGYSRGGVLEQRLNLEARAILESDPRFAKVQARYEQLNAFLSGLVESEDARASLLQRFQSQVPGGKIHFEVQVARPVASPAAPAPVPEVEAQPVHRAAPPAPPTLETIEFAPAPVTSIEEEEDVEELVSASTPLVEFPEPAVEEAPVAPLETLSIYFETDESAIAPEELTKLDRLMERLREPAEKRGQLLMMGFADHRGTFDYNHALSLERARSVRDALVEAGAAEDALRFAGFGESQAASSEVESDLRKDRRVDFVLMPNDFQPR